MVLACAASFPTCKTAERPRAPSKPAAQAADLYKLVGEHQDRSLIIASKPESSNWNLLFPNPTVAEGTDIRRDVRRVTRGGRGITVGSSPWIRTQAPPKTPGQEGQGPVGQTRSARFAAPMRGDRCTRKHSSRGVFAGQNVFLGGAGGTRTHGRRIMSRQVEDWLTLAHSESPGYRGYCRSPTLGDSGNSGSLRDLRSRTAHVIPMGCMRADLRRFHCPVPRRARQCGFAPSWAVNRPPRVDDSHAVRPTRQRR